jgi:hypothetical protein
MTDDAKRTALDLDAIEARWELVPKGSAKFVPEPGAAELGIGSVIIQTPAKSHAVVMMYAWPSIADAFIAAREDVPALIAEIRKLQTIIESPRVQQAIARGKSPMVRGEQPTPAARFETAVKIVLVEMVRVLSDLAAHVPNGPETATLAKKVQDLIAADGSDEARQ